MKKIYILMTIICLTLSFCACSENSDYSQVTPDTLELYISTDTVVGSTDTTSKSGTMSAVVKESAEDKGLIIRGGQNITMSDVAQKKTFEVISGEYEFSYKTSRVFSPSSPVNNYNRRLDTYTYVEGIRTHTTIKCLGGTDKILSFRTYYNKSYWSEGDTVHSEDDLREIANKFVTSIITQEEFENYVARPISYPQEFHGLYGLYYDRYVYGYQTDEVAHIIIDQDKKIIEYDFEDSGMFADVEEKFSKEQIDAVANALRTKIEDTVNLDSANISNPKLVVDINGGLYVSIKIKYKTLYDEIVYAKVG